jgi:exosortase/archaeosortase family protein
MRMVVSFIALSVAVAAFSCKQWWHRIAIVLLAVPVALFMNVIRVAVLGILSLFDADLAVGEAHTLIGTLLLIPAFLLLMGCVWALKKMTPDSDGDQGFAVRPSGAPDRWLPPTLASVVVALTLVGSAAAFTAYVQVSGYRLTKKAVYPLSGQKVNSLPRAFPAFDPVWTQAGTDDVPSAEVIDVLGSENFLTRWFVRDADAPGELSSRRMSAQLHAVYYTGMVDTVPHVPERCFVGGGLVTVPGSTRLVDVPLDTSQLIEERPENLPEGVGPIFTARATGTPVRVRLPEGVEDLQMNVTEFRAGDQRIFAGYFFIANGGVVPTAEAVRIQAFSLEEDYAYYLKVQFLSGDVESGEELAEVAAEFLNSIFGDIMLCVPDWIDVMEGDFDHEAAEAAYTGSGGSAG